MYIYLDIGADVVGKASLVQRTALEHLGRLSLRGHDYVVARGNAARALAGASWLSEGARTAYARIASSASIGTMPRPDFSVVASPEFIEVDKSEAGWNVPLEMFSSDRLTAERTLICEHIDDCRYYLMLAEFYGQLNRIVGSTVSLRPIGAGGSTTFEMVESGLARGDSFIAVVDSDKEFHAAPFGGTAAKCLAVLPDSQVFQRIFTTECRAIENCIPIAWIELTPRGKQIVNTLHALSVAEEKGLVRLRFYAKLKNDLLACDVDENDATGLANDLAALRGLLPEMAPKCDGVCNRSCTVLLGFGAEMPRQVLSRSGEIRRGCIVEALKGLPMAMALAKAVFEFGMAAKPVRV